MVTLKEYLDVYYNNDDQDREKKIVEYNRALVEEYPFVKLDNEYRWTWMDDMPEGWRLAFGKQMLDELKEELIRTNYLDKYVILQVKEKYGGLRWYTCGVPKESKIFEIVDKYEYLSETVCQYCGKPVEVMTDGWVGYYCKECADKHKLIYKDIN